MRTFLWDAWHPVCLRVCPSVRLPAVFRVSRLLSNSRTKSSIKLTTRAAKMKASIHILAGRTLRPQENQLAYFVITFFCTILTHTGLFFCINTKIQHICSFHILCVYEHVYTGNSLLGKHWPVPLPKPKMLKIDCTWPI